MKKYRSSGVTDSDSTTAYLELSFVCALVSYCTAEYAHYRLNRNTVLLLIVRHMMDCGAGSRKYRYFRLISNFLVQHTVKRHSQLAAPSLMLPDHTSIAGRLITQMRTEAEGVAT